MFKLDRSMALAHHMDRTSLPSKPAVVPRPPKPQLKPPLHAKPNVNNAIEAQAIVVKGQSSDDVNHRPPNLPSGASDEPTADVTDSTASILGEKIAAVHLDVDSKNESSMQSSDASFSKQAPAAARPQVSRPPIPRRDTKPSTNPLASMKDHILAPPVPPPRKTPSPAPPTDTIPIPPPSRSPGRSPSRPLEKEMYSGSRELGEEPKSPAKLVSTASFEWRPSFSPDLETPPPTRPVPALPPRNTEHTPAVTVSSASYEWKPISSRPGSPERTQRSLSIDGELSKSISSSSSPSLVSGPSSTSSIVSRTLGPIPIPPAVPQRPNVGEYPPSSLQPSATFESSIPGRPDIHKWSPPPTQGHLQTQAEFQRLALDTKNINKKAPTADLLEPPIHKDSTTVYIDSEVTCISTITNVFVYDTLSMGLLWEAPEKVSSIVKVGGHLWFGNRDGTVWTARSQDGSDRVYKKLAHVKPVTGIWSCNGFTISLCRDGKLNVWPGNSLDMNPVGYRTVDLFKDATFVDGKLWVIKGKKLHVYAPSLDSRVPFQILTKPIEWKSGVRAGSGTSGDYVCIAGDSQLIVCGHNDGNISFYNPQEMQPRSYLQVGIHSVTSIVKRGNHIWLGLKSGSIFVIDISTASPLLLKEWKVSKESVDKLIDTNSGTMASYAGASVKLWEAALSQDTLDRAELAMKNEAATLEPLKVQVLSWNVDAAKPSKLDPTTFVKAFTLDTSPQANPDILVIGLQEVVELENKAKTARNIIKKSDPDLSKDYEAWKTFFDGTFKQFDYQRVASKSLVGLYSVVFVKSDIADAVTGVDSCVVKTGMGGLHGNKGAVVIRMDAWNSSLCFVNCHLAAGHSSVIQRNKDAETILSTPVTSEIGSATSSTTNLNAISSDSPKPIEHEFCFFFGDTNYRINTARELAIRYIENEDWPKLYSHDQLAGQLVKNPTFSLGEFHEHAIDFPPTYKFDRGTSKYDTSDKKRIPAWCDRILYRGDGVEIENYESLVWYSSDHRPVTATFTLDAKNFK